MNKDREIENLVAQYQNRLFKLIFGMVKDEQSASDLTQETFLKAYQHIEEFENRSHIYTWLYKIAYNLSLNFLRKKKRVQELPFDESYLTPKEEEKETEVEEDLKQAINALPQKQKEVCELYFFQKCSHKEIAALLGIPIGTSRSRLYYAKKKLKDLVVEK